MAIVIAARYIFNGNTATFPHHKWMKLKKFEFLVFVPFESSCAVLLDEAAACALEPALLLSLA